MYQRECYIKRNCVNGMPDFRFETLPKLKNPASASENPTETTRGHIPKLILVTEVREHFSKIYYVYMTLVIALGFEFIESHVGT